MKTLPERAAYLLGLAGNSTKELARIAGVKPPSVSQWISGQTKSIQIEPATRLGKHFGLNPIWISKGTPPMRDLSPSSDTQKGTGPAQYPNELEDAPPLRPARWVPVVGEVQGGVDGYLLEMEYPVGHGDGRVPYHGRDREAYALRVRGDSMFPRYRAGEFVIVEPNMDPQPQEDVVVILKDGRKMLKLLNWINSEEAQFLSINDGVKPLTLQLSEIDRMQRVAGLVPRSGFDKG